MKQRVNRNDDVVTVVKATPVKTYRIPLPPNCDKVTEKEINGRHEALSGRCYPGCDIEGK